MFFLIKWLIVISVIIIFSSIIGKLTITRCHCNVCLVGKTAIVTGATSGIGYGTALKLASRGCRVILGIRSNLELTKEKIIAETNNPNIVVKYLDVSSFSSIRKFAKEINETEPRLDILINNAGIGASSIEKTEDGLDYVLQVNYYGAFLLTHLLIDLLKKSSPSRIIFNSSGLAFVNSYTKESFPKASKKYFSEINSLCRYGNSKLLLVIASKIFGEKLKDYGVSSYSLHPGWVKTKIIGQSLHEIGFRIWSRFFDLLTRIYGRDPEDGLHTILHLAFNKDLKKFSGKYFWDCKPFFEPPLANDKEFCNKVWKISEEMVKLQPKEKI